jgi:hypothetical protein
MLSRKRILWGIGVLGLGWCAALPFQTTSPPASEPPARPATSDLVLQPRDVALEVSLPSDVSPAVGLSSAPRQEAAGDRPLVRPQPILREGMPPQMAAHYPAESGDWSAGRVAPASSTESPAAVDETAPAAARLHRITDGDTLPDLAEKYLGRSDRYLELYEANRRILAGPDLLPIGAELLIPSPAAPIATGSGPLRPAARSDGLHRPQESSPLMPIPPNALRRSPAAGPDQSSLRPRESQAADTR